MVLKVYKQIRLVWSLQNVVGVSGPILFRESAWKSAWIGNVLTVPQI